MEDTFVESSARSRKKLLLLYVIAAFAYLAIDIYWPRLMTYIQSLPLCARISWLRGIAIAFFACLASVPVMLCWHARKVLRFRQLPLPGALVFYRTKIQRGPWVVLQAYFLFFMAVVIAVGLVYAIYNDSFMVLSLFTEGSDCNGT
jgi:hypothetical protein